jgi:hypothetical protein
MHKDTKRRLAALAAKEELTGIERGELRALKRHMPTHEALQIDALLEPERHEPDNALARGRNRALAVKHPAQYDRDADNDDVLSRWEERSQ